MVPPGNYTVIPKAQVAVRSWDEILAELNDKVGVTTLDNDRRRRELQKQQVGAAKHYDSGSLVWFADMEERYYERLKLLDAM